VTLLTVEHGLPGPGNEPRQRDRRTEVQPLGDTTLGDGDLDERGLAVLDVDDADGHQRLAADGVLGDLAGLTVADLRLGCLRQEDGRGGGLNTDGAQGCVPIYSSIQDAVCEPDLSGSRRSPCHTTCPLVYTSKRVGVYEFEEASSRATRPSPDHVAGSWYDRT
jgi:hypothetical protein